MLCFIISAIVVYGFGVFYGTVEIYSQKFQLMITKTITQ